MMMKTSIQNVRVATAAGSSRELKKNNWTEHTHPEFGECFLGFLGICKRGRPKAHQGWKLKSIKSIEKKTANTFDRF